jgi:hypothetical protein
MFHRQRESQNVGWELKLKRAVNKKNYPKLHNNIYSILSPKKGYKKRKKRITRLVEKVTLK